MEKCKIINCVDKYRTRFDKNEIIEYKDYAEIILYDKDQKEKARAKIDKQDIDNIKQYRWRVNSYGYVKNKHISLHAVLIGQNSLKNIFLNGDKLDNRRKNLRNDVITGLLIIEKKVRRCKVKDCNKKHYAVGYCQRHYAQFKKYGKVLERTRYDANIIVDCGGYYSIGLYNIKGQEVARAKIDKNDLNILKDIKWRLDCHGYVVSGIKKLLYMHNLLINKRSDAMMVFLNGDKLDNRRKNLYYKKKNC